MSTHETSATFTVEMTPAPGLFPQSGRFDVVKEWTGGVRGSGVGVMLSAGDPRTGAAGYVALETVDGSIDGRAGTFALSQQGTMTATGQTLAYAVVPGSGTGELTGLTGTVELTVDEDDTHRVVLHYALPDTA
ncbi:DUF3224 domain-containing protein [Microbacterium gorillae]|uniref:DUF3224 domain-containing protein n=1 Tax=Microbacterium gorillae TaxID=1231063 RepID=UPI00058ED896|nr:DUF3224 domain-containing protein [Microbacterium gorillae]